MKAAVADVEGKEQALKSAEFRTQSAFLLYCVFCTLFLCIQRAFGTRYFESIQGAAEIESNLKVFFSLFSRC